MINIPVYKTKALKYALYLYVLFVYYNTFIPFRFYRSVDKIAHSFGQILWIPFQNHGPYFNLFDLAGNIIVFMPIGFLIYLFFDWSGKRERIWLKTVFIGFALSFFIEFIQLFLAYRTTSVTDIMTNTFGTWLGALSALFISQVRSYSLQKYIRSVFAENYDWLLLALLLSLQIVMVFVPFDFRINAATIKQSLQNTLVLPFSAITLGSLFSTTQPAVGFSTMAFTEQMLFYFMCGYLAKWVLWRSAFSKQNHLLWIVLGLFAIVAEIFKLVSLDKNPDLTMLWAAFIGLFAAGKIFAINKTDELIYPLQPFLIANFLLLVIVNLEPFHFHFGMDMIFEKTSLKSLLPYNYYHQKATAHTMVEVFQAIVFGIPVGLWAASENSFHKERNRLLEAVIAGLVLGTVIEFFQLFLPNHIADPIDILTLTGGSLCGAWLYLYRKEVFSPYA